MLENTAMHEHARANNEFYGDKTPIVCCEEAGELIQAISKMERADTEEHRQALVDEIGDVYICLLMLRHMYKLDLADIDRRIDYKIHLKKDY